MTTSLSLWAFSVATVFFVMVASNEPRPSVGRYVAATLASFSLWCALTIVRPEPLAPETKGESQ
jgi:hypothetical protein